MRFLVINPNSSEKVTKDFEQIIGTRNDHEFVLYTAPSGPKEINGEETSRVSESIVLDDLIKKDSWTSYDGFLVCCFSEHPLIYSLPKYTDKPVLGIMQASLLYCLSNASFKRSVIITSFEEWEPLLDKAIKNFLGTQQSSTKFLPTQSFNINVLNLNNPNEFDKIADRTHEIIDESIDCIILGCAGMVGLDTKLAEIYPKVKFIDSVKVGVELLTSLAKFAI